MPARRPERQKIFISYSHKDKKWLEAILTRLKPLMRLDLIDAWSDQRIRPGDRWEDEIEQALSEAQVAILLISPDFLASDYIASKEVTAILKAEEERDLLVLPIFVRSCLLDPHPELTQFQGVNTPNKPLQSLTAARKDDVLRDAAKAVLMRLDRQETVAEDVGEERANRFSLPPRPGRSYVKRQQVLDDARDALERSGRAALWGMGGMGKTLAATEFAYANLEKYTAAFWVRAASRDDLNADFAELAQKLNLPLKDEKEQVVVVRATQRWLQENDNWLLVLDNVEDLGLVQEFVPPGKGHVLLTTQDPSAGGIAEPVEVKPLTPDESVRLLLSRSGLLTPGQTLDLVPRPHRADAEQLASELGGLPLALDQAGAFIEEMTLTPGEYLKLYRKQSGDLLAERGGPGSDHPSVQVTFRIAFENVQRASPAAADLLRFCSLLLPDAIPEEIVTRGADALSPDLASEVRDEFRRLRLYRQCRRYSLLRRDPNTRALSIHRVVQRVVRDLMPESERTRWTERLVNAVARAIAWPDEQNIDMRLRLLPQAARAAQAGWEQSMNSVAVADLMWKLGVTLNDLGLYRQAKPLAERALAIGLRIKPRQEGLIAKYLSDLGQSEWRLGLIRDAESHLTTALLICQRSLGPRDPNTGTVLQGLASIYNSLGRNVEAEALCRQAIDIYEKLLGAEHPNTLRLLGTLGLIYQDQGNTSEAETLLRRSLNSRQKVFGSDHRDTTWSRKSLAILLMETGRLQEAEELLTVTPLTLDRTPKEDYCSPPVLCNTLALVRCEQQRFTEARGLIENVIATQEATLGLGDPRLAPSLSNLGKVQHRSGNHSESEQAFTRALRILEAAFGTEHPDIADVFQMYGLLLHDIGRHEQAERSFVRALEIWDKLVGPDNPRSITAVEGYATLLQAMGRQKDAEAMTERARAIRSQHQLPPPKA